MHQLLSEQVEYWCLPVGKFRGGDQMIPFIDKL